MHALFKAHMGQAVFRGAVRTPLVLPDRYRYASEYSGRHSGEREVVPMGTRDHGVASGGSGRRADTPDPVMYDPGKWVGPHAHQSP